jgi:hypothetical protein
VNKAIYDSEIQFPDDKKEHMRICFLRAGNGNEDSEGYKRNKELQDKNYIGYKQLKRIKNFFDNFNGRVTDPEFVLNGGVEMKNWVNNELRRMREGIYMTRRNKMDTGMQNQFLSPHEKKDFTNVRPSQQHKSTLQKYDAAVTESLKRINELISKI